LTDRRALYDRWVECAVVPNGHHRNGQIIPNGKKIVCALLQESRTVQHFKWGAHEVPHEQRDAQRITFRLGIEGTSVHGQVIGIDIVKDTVSQKTHVKFRPFGALRYCFFEGEIQWNLPCMLRKKGAIA
jgi:hypothetical protein